MNNWFPLMNVIIAKKKLKDNNITESPKELLLGLFPGFQSNPVSQLITTNAVVDNAITTRDKEVVATQKAVIEKDRADLINEVAILGPKALPLDGDGKPTESEQLSRLTNLTKRFPEIRKKILESSNVSDLIKDKLAIEGDKILANRPNLASPQTVRHSNQRIKHSSN